MDDAQLMRLRISLVSFALGIVSASMIELFSGPLLIRAPTVWELSVTLTCVAGLAFGVFLMIRGERVDDD